MKKHYRTIKELVLDAYKAEGRMPSREKLAALVRQFFPDSKWKDTHYAWYKSKIKTGRFSVDDTEPQEPMADQIETEVEESIEARVSMERDLHDFLARHLTQLDPELTLHRGGVEFSTDAGKIDILAKDKKGNLVVVEIKAGKAKDGALGQILGYMGCLTRKNKIVRGILVASDFEQRVVFAARALKNVQLVKYNLNFGFKDVT